MIKLILPILLQTSQAQSFTECKEANYRSELIAKICLSGYIATTGEKIATNISREYTNYSKAPIEIDFEKNWVRVFPVEASTFLYTPYSGLYEILLPSQRKYDSVSIASLPGLNVVWDKYYSLFMYNEVRIKDREGVVTDSKDWNVPSIGFDHVRLLTPPPFEKSRMAPKHKLSLLKCESSKEETINNAVRIRYCVRKDNYVITQLSNISKNPIELNCGGDDHGILIMMIKTISGKQSPVFSKKEPLTGERSQILLTGNSYEEKNDLKKIIMSLLLDGTTPKEIWMKSLCYYQNWGDLEDQRRYFPFVNFTQVDLNFAEN